MLAKDLMDMEFPLLIPKQTVLSALTQLAEWGVTAAPVLDRMGTIGVFELTGQVLQYLLSERPAANPHLFVNEFMNLGIPVAREDQVIASIPPSTAPVIPVVNDKEHLVGVLWLHKLAFALLQQAPALTSANSPNSDELNIIMQSTHDGIVTTDGLGQILRVNRATEDILGRPAQELIGKNVRELIEWGLIDQSATQATLSTHQPTSLKKTTSTGKEYVATAIPVFNPDGSIERVVTNIRDITELVELKVALEDTKTQASELSTNRAHMRSRHMLAHGIVSKSPQMLEVIDLALKTAQFDATVLILGESGVGKELIAKLIHNTSQRKQNGQFIKVNCGAIPRELLESEFFGYEAGAFTGAKKDGKPGYFELAHQGTLFLDEIGELPLDLQVKLLRVIQEREFTRLGDTRPKKVDVRIIAATNRELEQMVSQGTFREDLYYRLNVLPINIPPLRSRPEDIPALLTAFLEKYGRKYSCLKMFAGDSLAILSRYRWPGNVRELENVVERLVITADDHVILPQHLPLQVFKGERPTVPNRQAAPAHQAAINPHGLADRRLGYEPEGELRPLQEVMDQVEKGMIVKALSIYGSTYRAAKVLGISQSTMVRKAKKYHQKTERVWHEE
ncbi:sigma 54-interacting transcriptional regulator [Paradesulfitobacterium ferrireducens]|uniref:sigma 54-interacting transcriptional regulator n=1 Tax=Paradesulfitobacterium ferrireducens TaxID=2816476 RepID=UPI001A8EB052|nr:sigma 54-interacting transcriptional regulator [Paradesulfitobacterium ferrireducens]